MSSVPTRVIVVPALYSLPGRITRPGQVATSMGNCSKQPTTWPPRNHAMTHTMTIFFRFAAIAEAVSWTGLLVGMVVKHLLDAGEAGVQLFGPIHGMLFVFYVVAALLTARARAWSGKVTLLALASAVPPLATLAFERWAARQNLFVAATPRRSAEGSLNVTYAASRHRCRDRA